MPPLLRLSADEPCGVDSLHFQVQTTFPLFTPRRLRCHIHSAMEVTEK